MAAGKARKTETESALSCQNAGNPFVSKRFSVAETVGTDTVETPFRGWTAPGREIVSAYVV
jgi:hypothetical protein